jgi:hypothetical protein
MPATSQLLKRAIQLCRAGKAQDARVLLRAVLREEPGDERAWIWYVDTLTSDRERILATEEWLRNIPGSRRARQALRHFQALVEQRRRETQHTPRRRTPRPTGGLSLHRRVSVRVALIWVLAVLICATGATLYLVANHPAVDSYRQLRTQYDGLLQTYHDLMRDYASLVDQRQTLERQHDQLAADYRALSEQRDTLARNYLTLDLEYSALSEQHANLTRAHEALTAQYETLSAEHAALNRAHDALMGEHEGLQQEYHRLLTSYDTLAHRSITPPYILVHDRMVTMAFVKRDNSDVAWDVPFDALERDINRGHRDRTSVLNRLFSTIQLTKDTGETISVTDYRKFVDASLFAGVMADLYAQSESDYAFIDEVWHIVGQLTSYADEIRDTPRYPLETLLAGGGDCEDTSILFASMIKAAPVDWTVELVYMDSRNPTALVEMNHLIVSVDTGQGSYLVETTSKTNMLPYNKGVDGWYQEIH